MLSEKRRPFCLRLNVLTSSNHLLPNTKHLKIGLENIRHDRLLSEFKYKKKILKFYHKKYEKFPKCYPMMSHI